MCIGQHLQRKLIGTQRLTQSIIDINLSIDNQLVFCFFVQETPGRKYLLGYISDRSQICTTCFQLNKWM